MSYWNVRLLAMVVGSLPSGKMITSCWSRSDLALRECLGYFEAFASLIIPDVQGSCLILRPSNIAAIDAVRRGRFQIMVQLVRCSNRSSTRSISEAASRARDFQRICKQIGPPARRRPNAFSIDQVPTSENVSRNQTGVPCLAGAKRKCVCIRIYLHAVSFLLSFCAGFSI